MVKGLPTDLQLLDAIYKNNLRIFSEYSDDNPNRAAKIWTPIDIEALAKHFRTDPDMIFGRLYYHLNGKYGQQLKGQETLEFFQPRVGRDRHCVNFPFLASVLADLRGEQKRFAVATGIAALSLLISAVSMGVALLT